MAEGQTSSLRSTFELLVSIAIDFGTHGTAVCSKLKKSQGAVRAESKLGWTPDQGVSNKTPTTLLLNEDFECTRFGAAAIDAYLQMDDDYKEDYYFCEKFKMKLFDNITEHDKIDGHVNIQSVVEADNGVPIPTKDVLKESLSYILNFVQNESDISDAMGRPLDLSRVQWVLTVPAIWSEQAKMQMRQAATEAGMLQCGPAQLIIAKEPECASLTVRDHVEPEQTYILVDAGGGTIDIACHKKVSVEAEYGVVEVFPPTGGSWGSTYIDKAFEEMIGALFGHDMIAEFKEDESNRQSWVEQMQLFQSAKENAKFNTKQNVSLQDGLYDYVVEEKFGGDKSAFADHVSSFSWRGVDGGLANRSGRKVLKAGAQIWEALFATVLDPITNHLNHLLDEPALSSCEQIILVGGFGGSDWLHKSLEDLVAERDRRAGRSEPSCTVWRPPNPHLAVVQGAAQFPWEQTKFKRIAARTYGVESLSKFVPGKHDDDEWKVEWNNGFRYRKGFKKFITIGDVLSNDHTVSHKFRPAARDGVSVNIYSSTEADPSMTKPPARQIGTTFINFDEIDMSHREDQILEILFHFGASEIFAELKFEDGTVQSLQCDFHDTSFAQEINEKYQRG